MGVVYKLKSEVRNFIVQKKKSNPKLSCRKLTKLVLEEYGVDVSKSSINLVLQEANLSRRKVDGGPQGDLGEVKRKENGLKKGAQRDKSPADLSDKPQWGPVTEEYGDSENFHTGQKIIVQKEEPEVESDLTPPMASGKKYAFMGGLLLKIAQWDIWRESRFPPVFGRVCGERGEELIDKIWEKVLCNYLLGDTDGVLAEDIPPFFDVSPFSSEEKRFLDRSFSIKEKVSFFTEIKAAFLAPVTINLILEDGSQIRLDATEETIWEDEVKIRTGRSFSQAAHVVVNRIIGNRDPLIVRCLTSGEDLRKGFFNLMWSFSNIAGKDIKEIHLLTDSNEKIVSFQNIPVYNRLFIGGLLPRHRAFKIFEQKKRADIKKVRHPLFSQEVFFQEIIDPIKVQHPFGNLPLRAAVILEGQNPKQLVLTNAGPKILPMGEVVRAYFSRWPYGILEKSLQFSGDREVGRSVLDELNGENQSLTIGKAIDMTLQLLSKHCIKDFLRGFPKNSGLEEIKGVVYGLPGYFAKTPGKIYVEFMLEEKANEWRDFFEDGFKKINEGDIISPEGARVVVGIYD